MSPSPAQGPARFVVITGLSGSGKSTALKALEDQGFYAVDNLPVELLPSFVKLPLNYLHKPFQAALGLDVRASSFVDRFAATYTRLAGQGYRLELLFLEASDEVLIRRFSETRRKPPLSEPGESVRQGLERERALLGPVRAMAHQIIDTSRFNIHDLRNEISNLYSHDASPAPDAGEHPVLWLQARPAPGGPIWSWTCASWTIPILSMGCVSLTGRGPPGGRFCVP